MSNSEQRDSCHDLAKMAKSLFNILFLFLFFYFSYQRTCKIKVTHMEAWDFNVRLGSDTCISRVENPTRTLSSSLCQTLNKETVGLIPVIRVWLLTEPLFLLHKPMRETGYDVNSPPSRQDLSSMLEGHF